MNQLDQLPIFFSPLHQNKDFFPPKWNVSYLSNIKKNFPFKSPFPWSEKDIVFSTSFFSSEVYHRQSLAQRGWQTALGRFVEGQRINSCLRVSQTTKLELGAHILNSSMVSEDTVVSQASKTVPRRKPGMASSSYLRSLRSHQPSCWAQRLECLHSTSIHWVPISIPTTFIHSFIKYDWPPTVRPAVFWQCRFSSEQNKQDS